MVDETTPPNTENSATSPGNSDPGTVAASGDGAPMESQATTVSPISIAGETQQIEPSDQSSIQVEPQGGTDPNAAPPPTEPPPPPAPLHDQIPALEQDILRSLVRDEFRQIIERHPLPPESQPGAWREWCAEVQKALEPNVPPAA